MYKTTKCPRCGKNTFDITERGGMLKGECMICGHRASISKKSIHPVGEEDSNVPVEQGKHQPISFSIEDIPHYISSMSRYSIIGIIVVILLVFFAYSQIGMVNEKTQEGFTNVTEDLSQFKETTKDRFENLSDEISTIEYNITKMKEFISEIRLNATSNTNHINAILPRLNIIEDDIEYINQSVNSLSSYYGDLISITQDTDINLTFIYNDTTNTGNLSFVVHNPDSLHEVEFYFAHDNITIDHVSSGDESFINVPKNNSIWFMWFGENTTYSLNATISYSHINFANDFFAQVEYDNVYKTIDEMWVKEE